MASYLTRRVVLMISMMAALAGGLKLPAEEPDHEIFLRYTNSSVVEASWTMTKARQVYQGAPATHEDRYRVIPCVVRLLDGTMVVVVEPGGDKPIFIRSTDGAKTWSKPYRGVLGEGVRTISNIGVRKDGRMMAAIDRALEDRRSTLMILKRKTDDESASPGKAGDRLQCEAACEGGWLGC